MEDVSSCHVSSLRISKFKVWILMLGLWKTWLDSLGFFIHLGVLEVRERVPNNISTFRIEWFQEEIAPKLSLNQGTKLAFT